MREFFTIEQLAAKLKRNGNATPTDSCMFYHSQFMRLWMFVNEEKVFILLDDREKLKNAFLVKVFTREQAAAFRLLKDGANLRNFYFADLDDDTAFSYEYTAGGFELVRAMYNNF